jgi:hypothetical protein
LSWTFPFCLLMCSRCERMSVIWDWSILDRSSLLGVVILEGFHCLETWGKKMQLKV